MSNNNSPTLHAYTVRDRGRGKPAIWTRIGAAWPHEKGRGFSLTLEALPLDGRVILTEPKPDDVAQSANTFEGEAAKVGG